MSSVIVINTTHTLTLDEQKDLIINSNYPSYGALALQIYNLASGVIPAGVPIPNLPPPTDTTIQRRTLSIPRDLSNTVIFTTNFYSFEDLSNDNVPNNLYSSNRIDISYEDVKLFWINKINNSSFNNDIDKGITIVSIQNLNNKKIGAHSLEFINWDASANGQFSNYTNNKDIFKVDNSYNLTPSMELISGIRNVYTISNEIVKIPLAIVDSSFNKTFDITIDSSDSFINEFILLGRPIVVNVKDIYDGSLNSIEISNVYWRSDYSAKYMSIDASNVYSDDISNTILTQPIKLIKGIDYTIKNLISSDISYNLDISYSFDNNILRINEISGNQIVDIQYDSNSQNWILSN